MSSKFIEGLKQRSGALKRQIHSLYFAGHDPRTPWYAKVVMACTVAYALSPIDLIPDFIPVIGYLDDLVIVPAGIALAIKLIPREIWQECCDHAAKPVDKKFGIIAAVVIGIIWTSVIVSLAAVIIKWMRG